MDTNFQVTAKTFQSLHSPLKQLKRNCVFTELYEDKEGKLVKKRTFQSKSEWLTWKKPIIDELIIQRQLANEYPNNFLQIIDYSVDTYNHKRFLYITYDCDTSSMPLFQYLDESTVNFEEQVKICDQILQISCLLQKFNCQHNNLKAGNLIYYRNKVLLTDFGSARTHHQNFTKQYSNQKEKEWQNQLMFYCPKEYLDIMSEENVDFRDDAWKQLNTADKTMRQKADKWAIGVMLIQVFENSQKLPIQINQFYGLNEGALNAKIKQLEATSNGLISGVVTELLINDSEPTKVYLQFLKFKQLINQKRNTHFQTEETHSFQQIFDKEDDDFKIERNQNTQQFYLDRKQIRELEQQYNKDDNSSVASQQRPIIECIEYSVLNGENLIPRKSENQLFISQQITKFKPPREDNIFASQNVQQVLYQDQQPNDNYKRNGLQKPSIIVTQPLQNRTPGQLVSEQDDEKSKLLNKSRPQSTNQNFSYETQVHQNVLNVDNAENDIENLVLSKNLGLQQFEIQAQAQSAQIVEPQNEVDNQLQSFKQVSSAQFKVQDSNFLNLQQVKEKTSHDNSGMISFKDFQQFSEVQDQNKLSTLDEQLNKQDQNQLSRNSGQVTNLQVQQSQNLMQYTDLNQNKEITNSQASLISFKNEPQARNNNDVMNLVPIDDDFSQVPQVNQLQNQSAFFANSGNNLQPVNDNPVPHRLNLPPCQNISQNFSLNQFQPTNQVVDPSFLASKQSVFSVEQMPTDTAAQVSQLIIVKEDNFSPESKPQQPSQFKFNNQNQQQLKLNAISNLNEQDQTQFKQVIDPKIQQENGQTQLQKISDDNEDLQKNQQQVSQIKAEFVQSGRFGQQLQNLEEADQKKINENKIINPEQQMKEKNLGKLAPMSNIKQPQVVQKIDRETQKIVDQIINPQNLKTLSEAELEKKIDSLEKIKQDIDEHQQNYSEEYQEKELNETAKIINWNLDQLKKLDANQIQQLEQQVDQQIIETNKKLEANKALKQKKIIDNPSLLNMLDENQLNQLANELENQKDQKSQEFLKQVQQMQQVNQQLQKFFKDSKTGNLLKNEEIKLLNQHDLQKYNEQVKRLLEKTKQEQQRERLKEQLKEIQKQIDISKLDARIQLFIDHQTVENLLPQDILDQLNPQQLQRYQNALEQQLPRATRLFKKEIEIQLNILKQIQQQQQQKQQKQRENANQIPEKIQKPNKHFSNTSSFEDQSKIWRDNLGCDDELFSLNKFIKAFQLDPKVIELREQIPENCKAIIENFKQDAKLKFQSNDFHPNRYQGDWLEERPNGFGRMREGKFSAIYEGVFINGKFFWGQAIELNDAGLITHYVGYYHEKYQVKNGKSKMVWYKPSYSFQAKKYTFEEYENFEGFFVLGKINGYGRKKYSDGSEYVGEWKNNLREGKGKLTLKVCKTTIIYDGIFQNDLLEGEVTTIHNVNKDLKEIGNYVKGKPVGMHSLFLGNKKQKDLYY